jgi:hypothetical protein
MTTALRGGPGTGRQYRPPWPRTQGPCSRTRIYGAPGRSAALAGTPDLLFMNIAQFRRDQRTRPTRTRPAADDPKPPGCAYPARCHTSARLHDATCRSSPPSPPPHSGHATGSPSSASCPPFWRSIASSAFGRQQNYPCAKHFALLRCRRPYSHLEHRSILRRQPDFRSLGVSSKC